MSELSAQNSSLVIGEGVTFVGSISAPGRASINGTVTGEVSVADLQIGPKGSVTGQINAQVIDVHGVLVGLLVQGLISLGTQIRLSRKPCQRIQGSCNRLIMSDLN